MDDQVIPDFNRPAVAETVVTEIRVAPAAPVLTPIPVVIAPPPRVEQPARPPGDIPLPAPNNPEVPLSLFTIVGTPAPVQTTNLAPDISTYPSANEPYFQLSSAVPPVPVPDTWYEFPTLTGSVLFNNLLPPPVPTPAQGELHAFGDAIFYNGDTLMPSTWYLNPALNGEVLLVDASGTQLLHSIDANLYYNNELLAKANDIQDIADWALYPALATVELAGNDLTQVGDIDASGAITSASLSTGGITASGAISSASLSTGGITATGGINAGISGVIAGGINTNGTGPVTSNAVTTTQVLLGGVTQGTLATSGTVLTWNGQAITTGTEGDAANWANYPAVADVVGNNKNVTGVANLTAVMVQANTHTQLYDPSGNPPLTLAAVNPAGLLINSTAGGIATVATAGNIATTTVAGDITVASYNDITTTTGNGFTVMCDGGINPLVTPNVGLTAQNGNGGQVNITANKGSVAALGGKVVITANGGTTYIPQPPPAPPLAVTVGGLIELDANTGGYGLYTASSAIKLSAASIDSYAGAIPPIGSLLGYNFIFGNLGVSICAGIPTLGFQFPGTVYIYGVGIPGVAGGVRLQSPQGIQMLSDTYIENLYPLDGNGLTIQGRSLPTGYVTIKDVAALTMNSGATIVTDFINSLSSNGIFYKDNLYPQTTAQGVYANFLKPMQASGAGTPNLVISSNPFVALGYKNFVQIQNADTIAFDVSGTGALTGVQTINGVAYPPPSGDSSDWATFPAVQNVDIAGYEINNVNNISMPTNATIISAGSLSIFADTSGGNLAIATNGGGAVSIGTGNGGDINITTSGAGHDLSLGGDTVQMTGTVAINIDSGTGDTNISANDVLINTASDFTANANTGNVALNAQVDINLYSTTGNVTLIADLGEVIVQDSVLNMNTHKITNLVAGTNPTDAVNLAQLTTVVTSKDSTEFYVSDAGNDVTGNGSFFAPFATIQKAITQAELVSSNILVCVINVASGHYNENLTFNKGYIILNGSLSSQTGNEVCEITGSISIALAGANDVFNRQVTFQGFNITTGPGQAVTDTSTASHTVTFQDCKVFAYQQFFVSTATCPDMRLYITNVEVQQTYLLSAFPVIVTNVGQAEFERLDVTCTGNATALLIGGTSVMTRLSLATLDTTNPNTPLLPLLSITSTTTATHSIGNVAFAFTSTVAKTNTNAMYIASGINTAILMFNSLFTLAGTASSTNYCIGYNGVGSPTIAGINNSSLNVNVLLPQTTSVQSGIAQIQYTNIQPPGLATYSSTADQVIAVSGTPQALTYNTTQFNQGTTLTANSRVYVNAQGNYNVSYSVELQHAGAGAVQIATTFLKKNGTTIANTGRQWSITSASFQNAATAEFVVSLNAGDYVEVFFNGDTSLSANATPAAGALPAIPSVVFNIKQFR